jgi:hypothetical protein
MFRKPLPATVLLLVIGTQVYAQNETDALNQSASLPGGTARSWALGGAFGAVGADPGSASTNPAGFGLYNTSEVSFTPQFEVNTANSRHYGNSTTAVDNRFSFNNLTLVLSYPGEHGDDWRGGVFGVSFDRQASFHWDEHAAANGLSNSILDQFANDANGTAPGSLGSAFPFGANLAYETYGINPSDSINSTYTSAIPPGTYTDQDDRMSTAGRINTTSIFFAANHKDKLYLGGSLGIAGARYEREITHGETVTTPGVDLKDLTWSEKLLTSGSGVNLKVGVIGRATSNLRLGLAFHSPTWLQLTDVYSNVMRTEFNSPDANGNTGYSMSSPDGSYNYRLRTPWSVLASAAYVVGRHGLVSVDYAYTDFRQAKLNKSLDGLDEYSFSTENDAIQNDLRATHSLRAGTEWRSGAWYFRGGAGIWPDAWADSDARQGTAYLRWSAGVGYRTRHVSIDLAGVYGKRETNRYPYDPDLVQPVNSSLSDARGMLTFAYRP